MYAIAAIISQPDQTVVPGTSTSPTGGCSAAQQARRRVHDEEAAHRQQRGGGDEVADADRPVEAVGVLLVGRAAREPHGHEEGDRRDEREQVLHPRGLHGLRAALTRYTTAPR